jgi:hypothetical protein
MRPVLTMQPLDPMAKLRTVTVAPVCPMSPESLAYPHFHLPMRSMKNGNKSHRRQAIPPVRWQHQLPDLDIARRTSPARDRRRLRFNPILRRPRSRRRRDPHMRLCQRSHLAPRSTNFLPLLEPVRNLPTPHSVGSTDLSLPSLLGGPRQHMLRRLPSLRALLLPHMCHPIDRELPRWS